MFFGNNNNYYYLAESYLPVTSTVQGGAAEGAAERKEQKYQQLANSYKFVPLAFETFGPINSKGLSFISELGRRLTNITDESREAAFLYQRLSVAIQRFAYRFVAVYRKTPFATSDLSMTQCF